MNNAERNRAFARERKAQIKQAILIQRDTAKEITALLAEARRKVEMQLAVLPTDYQQWYLPQIKAQIQAHLQEFNRQAGNVITLGADKSWNTGIDLIDAPVAAGGVVISQALPQINPTLLTAMKDFLTSRIHDISIETANKINGALANVLIGVQSPGEAIGSIAGLVEGGRGRAITITRTELGRAFSIAGQQRLDQAREYLPGMKKQWRRSGKLHSRLTHDAADGQIRETDKPFDVGGEQLMYPRDPKGSAKNTINCGCISIPIMEHWEVRNPDRLQFTDEELRLSAQKQHMQKALNAQARGENVGILGQHS